VSCPRCDFSVGIAEPRCPRCGFALIEQRLAGRGLLSLVARVRRSPRIWAGTLLAAAIAFVAAVGTPPALRALSAAFVPAINAMSASEAERHLAARYPRLRQAEHAVIACPAHGIEPGGQARCWVLARVGLQRSVVIRLSARGNEVHIDD